MSRLTVRNLSGVQDFIELGFSLDDDIEKVENYKNKLLSKLLNDIDNDKFKYYIFLKVSEHYGYDQYTFKRFLKSKSTKYCLILKFRYIIRCVNYFTEFNGEVRRLPEKLSDKVKIRLLRALSEVFSIKYLYDNLTKPIGFSYNTFRILIMTKNISNQIDIDKLSLVFESIREDILAKGYEILKLRL